MPLGDQGQSSVRSDLASGGKRNLPLYTVLLLPATAGAILHWSMWITYALLIPGLIWYAATDGLAFYRSSRQLAPRATWGSRVPILRVLPLVVIVTVLRPSAVAGLVLVIALVIVDFWYVR